MKKNIFNALLISTVLASTFSLAALAETTEAAVDKVQDDNAKIHHENKTINKDEKVIANDKKELNQEVKERNSLQAKENAEIKEGDYTDAKKLDTKRAHEQKEVNQDKSDLTKHKTTLAKDKRKRRHTVQQRNNDASKIK